MNALTCTTCRMIRRFLIAFLVGIFVSWQLTGSLPFDGEDADAWRAMLLIIIMVVGMNIVIRVRQMRARWRR